jgi:radical SAM superfamily enzyme YgiQ (UPF0313 family)
METGRGCKFKCDFCSVTLFFKGHYRRRPIDNIVAEIKESKNKNIMFVDDNICADFKSAKELLRALIPLKIKWNSSASVNIVHDKELLNLLKESGCQSLLVGFESIDKKNLEAMNKRQNLNQDDVTELIKELYKRGIKIYGSFVMGYKYENEESAYKTLDFALNNKFVLANFYQLTPLPGTRLYKKLEQENRLIYKKWWLDPNYSYGEVVFRHENMDSVVLSNLCKKLRLEFYSFKSIFKRSFNFGPKRYLFYWVVNLFARKEIIKKQGRILGRIKKV